MAISKGWTARRSWCSRKTRFTVSPSSHAWATTSAAARNPRVTATYSSVRAGRLTCRSRLSTDTLARPNGGSVAVALKPYLPAEDVVSPGRVEDDERHANKREYQT